MLRFDPPENATYAEKYPGPGWISCGWQLLEAWKGARGYREISRDLGCSPALLSLFKQGKTPATHYLEKLECIADVPPIAWKHWICIDPVKAAEFDGKGPLTIEMARAAADWLPHDPEWCVPGTGIADTTATQNIKLCLVLLESREHVSMGATQRAIDAVLEDAGWYVRQLLMSRRDARTRTQNAA